MGILKDLAGVIDALARSITPCNHHAAIRVALDNIDRKLDNMATQQDVDAIVTAVDAVSAQLEKAQAEIVAEVQRLKDANPALDLSALSGKVDALAATSQALDDLNPDTEPEPTPEPTPEV